MDFSLTKDQESIRALAKKIFEEQVTPERLKEVEAGPEVFDRRLWDELAKAGLLGIAVPESEGGSGMGFIELCILLEEAGRTVAPVPLLPTLVMGAQTISEFGTPQQRSLFLRRVVSGEAILTAALTEPGSPDPMRPACRARRDGSGWRLDGVKICVPAAPMAERILVPARTGDGSVGVFLIGPDAEGVSLEPEIATTDEPQSRLTLSNARAEEADALGDPLSGSGVLEWIVERAIVGLCAIEVGVADRSLQMTAEYTTRRHQFEQPIASFQAVGQRAADAYIDVEAIRLTMWQAAWRLAQRLPASKEVAVAKYWASQAGFRVAVAAQHLHGGIGYDKDYPLFRYSLLSKKIELALGGAMKQLERLGAELAREAPDEG